jgi:photosystem II stability/assembly factor-like uncharacterized protein
MAAETFISTTGNGITRAICAASGRWSTEALLAGVDVRCLAADPLCEGRVYAGTQGTGVMRSDDGGKSWQPSGLEGRIVKAVAASPLQPGTVFAGTKPACIFVSHDGGRTWAELLSFRRIPWRWLWLSPAEKPFIGYAQAIALSPTDPQRIAVGIEAGAIVLSRDEGLTWTRHRRGALRDCHSLTFHATQGSWLYAGGGTGGGAAVSRDAGRTWSRPIEGLDGHHYGWAVASDPGRPDIWYLSASTGPSRAHSEGNAQAYIFRNDGGCWLALSGGLPQPFSRMPYALVTDPSAPGHLYAGLNNGDIWHSDDHGDHWRQLPVNMGSVHRSLVMLKEFVC